MDAGKTWRGIRSWIWLLAGSACFTFVGWKFNVPFAAWIAPIFLIRFFRDQKSWYPTLVSIPLLAAASFIQLKGGWDLDAWMVFAVSVLRPAAFLVALYTDRVLSRRLPRAAATFVYPAVYLAIDYAISFTPFGSGFSASATQLGFPAISQLASLTDMWGIGFLMGWTAAAANTLWEDLLAHKKTGRIVFTAAASLLAVVAFGSARFALTRPSAPTVRVGAVTVEHQRDYWNWIDQSTPRDLIAGYAPELSTLEERLFAQSQRAVSAGAKIVFWSEGDAVLTEDNEGAFMERASAFAQSNGLYFAPAMVVLRYGQTISDNKIVMFAPDGHQAFAYVKTMSWYPTGSDGILKSVATPYGRIGAAICFDMDFPPFIRALGKQKADIVLVPAFDTRGIRPYHTEVGLMRGLENGFSVVRMTNTGTSMAIDGSGRTLARQEFFETADRLMLADVPTRRVPTLYGLLGEWFAWAGIACALCLVIWGAAAGRKREA